MQLVGVLSLASFVALSSLALAHATTPGQTTQAPQPAPSTAAPQRMPARPLRPGEQPQKGTATIKGQVRAAGTGAPVRRAQVRAMSMEGRGGGVTSTDNEGNFEIKELPAGRYNVSVSKGGFVTGTFGQRRPGEPGTPIDLSDGQAAERVNFQLARGGVISGRIFDDGGEPVAGTIVTAMRYQYVNGARRLVQGGSEGGNDRTDDQGNFRLYGLAPGDYYISASNRNNMMVGPNINNTEADSFAPTYYPGTASGGEATRITLKAGQEMTGANFALIVARMARVRGRAYNSSGQPVSNAMLTLTPADIGLGGAAMNISNAVVAGDGAFQFTNVPPGRYNLYLRPQNMGNPASEMATLSVTVGNEDVDNVIVTSAPAALGRGLITTDDGSAPSFRADQVSIFAAPATPDSMFMLPGQSRVNEDYTFELTGLSDRRVLRPNVGGSTGWYLKAVLYDGNDITDTGMEFSPGRTYEGLQIIFTQRTTDLSGAVIDDRGNPVLDATVVVFPANADRWTYQSRYVRTARPDTSGRYAFKSMPPLEDYLIIAVQNLEAGQGSDPEFLARAREEAKPFSLNEGETKAVDTKLSKLIP